MEYKINNFNLSDFEFNYVNFKTSQNSSHDNNQSYNLSSYLEAQVIPQKIKNILIGPNIINFKYPNETKEEKENIPYEENKKIINTISRLLMYNLSSQKDQTIVLQSTSNYSTKSYLKKVFKELEALLNEKLKIDNKESIFQSFLFFDFLTYFTSIKSSSQSELENTIDAQKNIQDEISLCDYTFEFSYTEGKIKLGKIETFHENFENLISQEKNQNTGNEYSFNLNNLHIFYMILYNLPINDLKSFLICDQTKELFSIFSPDIPVEDYVKRYVFINWFKLLKNESQFQEFSMSDSNVTLIYKEYEFYKTLYSNFLQICKILGVDAENEKKIFEIFFAILLLYEYEITTDPIAEKIIEKVKIDSKFNKFHDVNQVDMVSTIKNVIFSDYRFKSVSKGKRHDDEKLNILQKIALNLNISEEKIVFILLMDLQHEKVKKSESQNLKKFFIKTIYHIFLDKIKFIFKNYTCDIENSGVGKNSQSRNLKSSNTSNSSNTTKLNIIISRSNQIYDMVYLNNLKNKKIVDSQFESTYLVGKNIREILLSNYFQDLKNYFYLKNSLNITGSLKEHSWPSISYNENYISKVLNEGVSQSQSISSPEFSFTSILNLFEHNTLGILQILDDTTNFSLFKQHFDKVFYKKNLIELINNSNSNSQINHLLKIKHSFGTFHYDLSELIKEQNLFSKNYSQIEDLILKFLDYKPSEDYTSTLNLNLKKFQSSVSNFKKLQQGIVFISYLIKVGKFKLSQTVKDFNLHHVQYFYNSFFSYIINMKEIRENLLKKDAKKYSSLMSKDDLFLFKNIIAKKVRICQLDYYLEGNGYVYARNNFNRILDANKNIANLVFKYNHKMFYYLIVKKVTSSCDFNYFNFVVNSVRAYLKIFKIYQEKKVFKMTKNLLCDIILEQYLDNEENSFSQSQSLSQIDKIENFEFDFKFENLGKILPKLFSNLGQLKKFWRNYISDIIYLENYKNSFFNSKAVEKIIEERVLNFYILLFLFSKKYNFVNFDILKKNGILHSVFTKNLSSEVQAHIREFHLKFSQFSEDENFKNFVFVELNIDKSKDLNITNLSMEKLISKRMSMLKEVKRRSLNVGSNVNINISLGEMASMSSNQTNPKNQFPLTSTEKNSNLNFNKIIPNNSKISTRLDKFVNTMSVNSNSKSLNGNPKSSNNENIFSNEEEKYLLIDNTTGKQKVNLRRLSHFYNINSSNAEIQEKDTIISNTITTIDSRDQRNHRIQMNQRKINPDDFLINSMKNEEMSSNKSNKLSSNSNYEKVNSNENNEYQVTIKELNNNKFTSLDQDNLNNTDRMSNLSQITQVQMNIEVGERDGGNLFEKLLFDKIEDTSNLKINNFLTSRLDDADGEYIQGYLTDREQKIRKISSLKKFVNNHIDDKVEQIQKENISGKLNAINSNLNYNNTGENTNFSLVVSSNNCISYNNVNQIDYTVNQENSGSNNTFSKSKIRKKSFKLEISNEKQIFIEPVVKKECSNRSLEEEANEIVNENNISIYTKKKVVKKNETEKTNTNTTRNMNMSFIQSQSQDNYGGDHQSPHKPNKDESDNKDTNLPINSNFNLNYQSLSISPKKNYHTEQKSPPVICYYNLSSLKEIDDQIEILKKELNSLDLIEAIAKSTSQLCLNEVENEIKASHLSGDGIDNHNSDGFYDEISRELNEISRFISHELA